MCNRFYKVINEVHTGCCACCQDIDWNVGKFLEYGDDNGFIVQKYCREVVASRKFNVSAYQNISYYEAWKISNGNIISKDKGIGCNDSFSIGNINKYFDQFYWSFGTQGKFTFMGTVFWIPQRLPEYEVVNLWSRDAVPQARRLKASKECQELEKFKPIEIRDSFIHSWDLTSEEKIYKATKSALFNYCRNNTDTDRRYLDEAIKEIFGDKYRRIADLLRNEWEAQWDK